MNSVMTMDNFQQYKTKYNLKEPLILLERCDKIFNTPELIRRLDNTAVNRKDDAEIEDKYSSDKSISPYIKYQPLLCNGNGQLPYFNLSIKQSKSLIPCEICGKQFLTTRSKNVHAIRLHGVSLVAKTQRKRNTSSNQSSKHLEDSQNAKIFDKTKSTTTLTKKTDKIENNDDSSHGVKATSEITEQTSTAGDTGIHSNQNKTENKNEMKVSKSQTSCKKKTDDRATAVTKINNRAKGNKKNLKPLNALSLLKHKDNKVITKSITRTPKSPGKCLKSSPPKSPAKSPKANQGTWSVSNSPARNLLKNFMISSPEQTLMRRWLMSDQTSSISTSEPLIKRIKIEKDDTEIPLKVQDETESGRCTPIMNNKISERINNSETSSNHEVTSTVTDTPDNSISNNLPLSERNKTVLRHNGMTMLPPPAYVICTLCGNTSDNIKKHIVEYHKVTEPSLLVQESIAQSYFEDLMGSADKEKDQTYKSDIESKSQEKRRSQKRKRPNTSETDEITKEESRPSAKKSKPNKPSPASTKISNKTTKDNNDTRLERKSSTESNSKKKKRSEKKANAYTVYNCNICQRIIHGKYRLEVHEEAHTRRGETLENLKDSTEKSSHKSNRKSKKQNGAKSLEPMTHNTTELNGVDESVKQASTKKGKSSKQSKVKQKIQEEPRHSEYFLSKCTCGKSFSSVTALEEHKIYCDSNNRESDANQSIESPTGRVSSHGLSLTIKKKNNSYEIVHKDIVDEEMSNVSSYTKTDELSSTISVTSSENAAIENSPTIKKEVMDFEEDQNNLNNFPNFLLNMEMPKEDNNNIPIGAIEKNQEDTEKRPADPKTLRLVGEDTLSSENITSQIVNDHRCILCEKFFSSKSKIMKHWSEHVLEMLCDCEENILNMQEYEDHIHKIHPKIVTCGYCAKKFETLFDFGEHRCDVTKGKPLDSLQSLYPCLKCNKNFRQGTYLDRHIQSIHPNVVNLFQCYNCSQRFSTKDERKKHMTEFHVKNKCSICYKLCTHKLKNKHESYHHGLGFPCHVCKKAYSNKESFTHHVMVTHISKIECVICKKILKASSFKKHFKRHQNEDGLLQCILCKRTFSTNEELINHHMKKHNFEKSCEICGMNFLTKSSVQQHIANVHSNVYENRNIVKEEVTLES